MASFAITEYMRSTVEYQVQTPSSLVNCVVVQRSERELIFRGLPHGPLRTSSGTISVRKIVGYANRRRRSSLLWGQHAVVVPI